MVVTDKVAANAIKVLFADAAALAQGAVDAAAVLHHASTHWLRHMMLSAHANKGVNLKTLQGTAGHASIATISRYLHRADNDRHDEIMACIRDDSAA
jgi:site-specific recombinase XerD